MSDFCYPGLSLTAVSRGNFVTVIRRHLIGEREKKNEQSQTLVDNESCCDLLKTRALLAHRAVFYKRHVNEKSGVKPQRLRCKDWTPCPRMQCSYNYRASKKKIKLCNDRKMTRTSFYFLLFVTCTCSTLRSTRFLGRRIVDFDGRVRIDVFPEYMRVDS